jgi:hypothetical protein
MALTEEQERDIEKVVQKVRILRQFLSFDDFEKAILPELEQVETMGVEALEQLASQCGVTFPVGYFRKGSEKNN